VRRRRSAAARAGTTLALRRAPAWWLETSTARAAISPAMEDNLSGI
jgi:hypothetical protein